MSQRSYKRRKYIVDHEFQYGMIRKMAILAVLIVVVSLSSLALIYHLYGDVQVEIIQPVPFALSESGGTIEEQSTILELLWPVLSISLLATLVVIFVFGVVISHRMAGPVYSMRRALAEMARGDLSRQVHLRKKDAFKPLAKDINGLKERWRMSIQELKRLCRELESGDNSKQKEHLSRLSEILSTFKTE
ncbi:MAG: methyl-accepting chemotaxis protein [Deltaproteobacteria bacterium]|nr:methyl-accepting chemotaxis protein [Deltaproteobacteria bacterium]MBW2019149.1 methyl-accepting chemotaxis protein [Deltaproteobacteria bacterium]MBW2073216.1 methyl-accepting chemotaxis protein [Deltaproteobacteria bacterium]RLB83835.1 MAG: hypothetical protein DRH17_01370 [Deltaproteobacteria bacterium]